MSPYGGSYVFKQQTYCNGGPAFRYLAPESTSGSPGVSMFRCRDGRYRVYSHHTSDPLSEPVDGKQRAHDALDLIRILETDGDKSEAYNLAVNNWMEDEDFEKLRAKFEKSHKENGSWPRNKLIPKDMFPDVKRKKGNKGLKGDITGLKSTLENLELMLKCYGVELGYNVITKEAEVEGLDKEVSTDGDDRENTIVSYIESLAGRCDLPTGSIASFISALSMKRERNPVVNYFEVLKWDGKSRIQELADTLTVPSDMQAARDFIIKRFLISICAAADAAKQSLNADAQPKYEYVLVLQGLQGVRKTTWFNYILPEDLRQYMKDGAWLDANNTDSVRKATRYVLVELGELDATFRRSDVARMKAYLSERFDVFRKPYSRSMGEFTRRTVYCATVNGVTFLSDPTGNRRYWALFVSSIQSVESSGIDLDQLWAEAWQLYLDGEQWWPTDEEERLAERARQYFEYRIESPVFDRIRKHFGGMSPEEKEMSGTVRMTAAKIAKAVNWSLKGDDRDQKTLKTISAWLEKNNLRADGGPDFYMKGSQRFWNMPKITGTLNNSDEDFDRYKDEEGD